MLPGRGIVLNNFLGEEDINPAGFHRQDAGERMTSMMCPTILFGEHGRPRAALGTQRPVNGRTANAQSEKIARNLHHDCRAIAHGAVR